jgi:hypothetical protein
MKSFEQFCQAITELLLSREAQAEAITAIYQGLYDKKESGSFWSFTEILYTFSVPVAEDVGTRLN